MCGPSLASIVPEFKTATGDKSTERSSTRAVLFLCGAVGLGSLIGPSHTASAQTPVPSGAVITIAGNGSFAYSGDGGQATAAGLAPYAVTVGSDGSLYIADPGNYRIRVVDPTSGTISTVAGNGSDLVDDGPNGDGGPATAAEIGNIYALSIDREGNGLYLPSFDLNRVRRVNLDDGIITNFAGSDNNPPGWVDGEDGPAASAYLVFPIGTDVGPDGDVFITDSHRLRRVDSASGIIHRVAGIEDEFGQPLTETGGDGGPAIEASFTYPHNLKVDNEGNVFVLDLDFDGHLVRRIDAATGIITRVAGGGTNLPTAGGQATDIDFTSIWDIAPDNNGNLFIADGVQVFKLVLATGEVTTYAGTGTGGFAGDGGSAIDAQFGAIVGMAAVPGGGLLLADSDNARVRYIAPDSIHLVGDDDLTEFQLPWVSALTGSVTISDNPNVTSISLSVLSSVTGTVEISDNAATGVVDLSGLETAGGSVAITSNGTTGVIDLSSLESVTGDVTITSNGNASVSMSSLGSVTGNITLESTGTGTFSIGSADVTGNVDLGLNGYTSIDASTAGGSTAVTMINHEATMEVTLPDGAFTSATPVSFNITNLPSGSTETVDSELVTHLASYAFDFAIPALNSAATLNFEIDLSALDEPTRLVLLNLVDESAELTLGVRGDAPGDELQLFDVCASGGPMADGCVVVQWLDENRMLLDPLGSINPSILRMEGLVGHFSTYSFVAVGLAGDYNLDGTVNAADYTVWRNTLGQTIEVGSRADGTGPGGVPDGLVDHLDYAFWKAHYGNTVGSGAASGAEGSEVPEPATMLLSLGGLILFSLAGSRNRRRSGRFSCDRLHPQLKIAATESRVQGLLARHICGH
jgi:hypothetical protein